MPFHVRGKGFWKLTTTWKLNFRIGGRTPGHNPLVQNPPVKGILNQGVMAGGLRPPVLKFSFQVGEVWFCGFYPALPLNGGFWPRGVMSGEGVMSSHRTYMCVSARSNVAVSRRRYMVTPVDKRILLRTGLYGTSINRHFVLILRSLVHGCISRSSCIVIIMSFGITKLLTRL